MIRMVPGACDWLQGVIQRLMRKGDAGAGDALDDAIRKGDLSPL